MTWLVRALHQDFSWTYFPSALCHRPQPARFPAGRPDGWPSQPAARACGPAHLQQRDLFRQQHDAQAHHQGVLHRAQHLEREGGGRLRGGGGGVGEVRCAGGGVWWGGGVGGRAVVEGALALLLPCLDGPGPTPPE